MRKEMIRMVIERFCGDGKRRSVRNWNMKWREKEKRFFQPFCGSLLAIWISLSMFSSSSKLSRVANTYFDILPKEAEQMCRPERKMTCSSLYALLKHLSTPLKRKGNVLLLSSRLGLNLRPSVRHDALTDVLTIESENMSETASTVTGVGNIEGDLSSDELGTKEFTALEVPCLSLSRVKRGMRGAAEQRNGVSKIL